MHMNIPYPSHAAMTPSSFTDPPGWALAHSDTDIRDDEQAPTSLWKAGARGEAFSLLRFPVGAPPGDYALWAVVYWWQTPTERLPVTSSAGLSLGDHALIATVTVR